MARPSKAALANGPGAGSSLCGGLRGLGFGLLFLLCFVVIAMKLATTSRLTDVEIEAGAMGGGVEDLHVATWNIAAINNNPFEYWLTYNDAFYKDLMDKVQAYIEDPDDAITVEVVFTPAMYAQLRGEMAGLGWPEADLGEVDRMWEENFRTRTAVNGFLKDAELGFKRLASMPDRVTNTVNREDGGVDYRPTVINCYQGKLADIQDWWAKWQAYMFQGAGTGQGYAAVLKPIKKSKYPAVTELEERVSLPLQTLCLAIFDAIQVDMLMRVQPPGNDWQTLRGEICDNLNLQKNPKIMTILTSQYSGADIILLQEVAKSFIQKAKDGEVGQQYHVLFPASLDPKRDQNSVILLRKDRFDAAAAQEVTETVFSNFPEGVDVPVAQGDIFATIVRDQTTGQDIMVASFHGDTNGLASKPVVTAMNKAYAAQKGEKPGLRLLFGLDANTYRHEKDGYQNVLDFAAAYVNLGLTSCFGDQPDPNYVTTYNARTYLQPQLNKAVKSDETAELGDVNPKDFILFGKNDFTAVTFKKDNTGAGNYIEHMVFPTLNFPSDHGVLSALLRYIR